MQLSASARSDELLEHDKRDLSFAYREHPLDKPPELLDEVRAS